MFRQVACLGVLLLISGNVLAQKRDAARTQGPNLANEISLGLVPRLPAAPRLDDFEGMEPVSPIARSMLKADKFIQHDPVDGAPASQRTEAYLGYTDKSFFIIFLAFDSDPRMIRARMLRRELIDDDDQVGFFLDTFHDHRHAYYFYANPYGIQQDGLWGESSGPDNSFDTVWRTDARLNSQGYMELFEIPFKSLRFEPAREQTWGIMLTRVIPRNTEHSFCPPNSMNTQGWLTKEGAIEGFKDISPGRNLQFIPYTSMRAFRALDATNPAGDFFGGRQFEPKEGLDSKIVIHDSLVLDSTINPDFAQVESDDPQVTVNQRFEVFFPEKRPFFQENSNFFQTPINLLFTRRIVDPMYGVRLTGKINHLAIGSFIANDQAPGKAVIDSDPLSGNNAQTGVFRINRELGSGSSVGFMYTDRELHTAPNSFCTETACEVGFNRVGGFDSHIKINQNWQLDAQAVTTDTKFNNGTRSSGPAYDLYLERSSRNLEFNSLYLDVSPGFETELGFVPRTDMRRFSNFVGYTFRPNGRRLTSHGPRFFEQVLWDHNGTRLDYLGSPAYEWDFQRASFVNVSGTLEHERLRPVDFPALPANQDYTHLDGFVAGGTQFFKWLNVRGEFDWGTATNFVPASGPPVLANSTGASVSATVRPTKATTIDNTYLLSRLLDRGAGLNIFNNHIVRSRLNYQFTKAFSLRLIGEYSTTIANPGLTSLQNTKAFNGDVLFTYMVNPGTAIYAGYNSDLQNLDPSLAQTPNGLLRGPRFINDGRQVFVKISYLFRY